ncbi:MAG: ABC transporter permease [Anaerolineae bacterium]|nr:ABC transporter permease [Anaerolineae bacterium]
MKKIFAIVYKDTIIHFSSFMELLFFIILPVVFTVALAGGTPSGNGDNRIRLTTVDEAGSSLSAQVIAELEKSASVRPVLSSRKEAEREFSERRVSTVLFIPAGFDLDRVEVGLELQQQPNNLNALVAERAVQAALSRVSSAMTIAQNSVEEAEKACAFASDAERQSYFAAALEKAQTLMAEAPARLTIARAGTPDQIEYDPAANSSAGQLITWVFIPLLGLSELFASERRQGTLRRLLTTPTHSAVFLLGTIGGQVLSALAQMTLLVLFGVFIMKLEWGREPLALAVLLTAFALAAAALGTTLGTFTKTEGQANGLSIMLGMVMALLGGCWYPIELFPTAMQRAVKVLPTAWAMQGMLDLVLRGGGLVDILPEVGVLLGFALVFFVVGVWRFKFE